MEDIRFDGWTLRRSTGELHRDGSCVRLQDQPLTILIVLLERPGELVTREQLIARLWPKGVVDFDTALNSAMRRLRTALGDQAEAPRLIETLPRRGYRFIGRVEIATPAPSPSAPIEQVPARGRPAPAHAWWVTAASFLLCSAVVVVGASRWFEAEGAGRAALQESTNPEAQEPYERARFFLQRRAPGDLDLARVYFEQALAFDPRLARAWSGLASVHFLQMAMGKVPRNEGLEKIRTSAQHALDINPELAEAHVRMANYHCLTGDRRRGEEQLRRALILQPDDPLALSTAAASAAGEGRIDEAIDLQRRAVKANPLELASRHNLGVWLYLSGRYTEARKEFLQAREMNPSSHGLDSMIGLTLILDGRFQEAMQVVDGAAADGERLQALAMAAYRLGQQSISDSALETMIRRRPAMDPVRIAEVYAYRGDSDRAFEWLEHAVRTPEEVRCSAGDCWSLEMAAQSPFLRMLDSDPRWNAWSRAARREGEAPPEPARKG